MKQIYIWIRHYYKIILSCFILGIFLVSNLFSQTYVNGNLGTSATSNNGTAAPAGTMWHEMQHTAGNTTQTNGLLGSSHVSFGANNFSLADDFTVPTGQTWAVTTLRVYSIDQVTTTTTSPYTNIRVRIYNGIPGAGGAVVFGDMTTNRFASTAYTNKRAIFNSLVPTPGPPAPDIPIFSIDANINSSFGPGTYWIEWQVVNTANCFSPTSQTIGVRTLPGYNARQGNAGVFTALIDGGNPATAPDVAVDLPFSLSYSTGPCSGTPAPGATVSSASSVCPATSFTLSLSTPTDGSGVTYQWQSSSNAGGPFTNITGATNSTYNTTLTATTFYQATVTCAGNTGTSTPVQVSLSPTTSCYCAAGATDATFESISNVTLNSINNNSTATTGYQNFTALSTSLEPGRPYPFSVSIAGAFAEDQVIIFIDYNQNGTFTDAGETVYSSSLGIGPHAGTLVIPFAALPGATRMRVRMHDTGSTPANATSCGNSAFGQVEDYTVNILPVVPCTGTPNPGNTVSTVPAVCSGTNFTLSLQNFTSGSGVTYQWQSSATGASGSFTNITGATSVILTRSQTAATYYQAIVTCGASSATSTPIQVTISAFTNCYCVPQPPSNCNLDDRISNVTIGLLNNSSGCSTGGYTSYISTIPATDIVQGAPNPMKVTVGPGGNEFVGVWIDYNHNASYESSEFTLLGTGNGVTISNNINIPATAPLGLTGMRVRVRYNVTLTGTQSCLAYAFGETEDYLVNIVPCVPVSITSQPAAAAIICGSNATFTAAAVGSLPVYQWEYRVSATSPWLLVPNAAPYGGANTSSLTITNAPVSLNGYQFRAIISGACTGPDFTSNATLTVNPFVLLVTPGSGSVCSAGGTPILLSVPNNTSVATFTNNTPGLIPDGNQTGITRTFTVSGISGTILNMRLIMNVTHPYASDVIFVLKAPNGNILNMSYAVGLTQVAGANFTNTALTSVPGAPALSSASAPWTGNFRPDAQLVNAGVPTGPAGFAATVASFPLLYSIPNGTWTLAMYDYGTPDEGSFANATLEITSGSVPATAVFTPITGLFTNAAATAAYTGGPVAQVYALPAASTTYTAVVSTATCSTAPQLIPISLNTPPAAVSAVANKSICPLGNTSFTATVTGGAGFTYQWKVSTDGGATYTSITNAGVYSGASTGTLILTGAPLTYNGYKYVVEVATAGCLASTNITSAPGTLTVNPNPVIVVSANPFTAIHPGQTTTLTAAVSPNPGASYTWFRDGVIVPGATASTLVVDIDGLGNYTVSVTDVNGCTSLSAIKTIQDDPNDRLFIYPNPNRGQFQVRYFSDISARAPRFINIYDGKGARVFSKSYNVNSPYTRLDVDMKNQAKGIYSVELTDNKGNRIKTGRIAIF